jgi:hypothetical protein
VLLIGAQVLVAKAVTIATTAFSWSRSMEDKCSSDYHDGGLNGGSGAPETRSLSTCGGFYPSKQAHAHQW